nr:MAG TPA_asm: hypothetical protein [Caudoviricetes sp.]
MLLSLFLYHKDSYKALRTADMVGYGRLRMSVWGTENIVILRARKVQQ